MIRLDYRHLIIPGLLIVIYGFLSYISLFDQSQFYTSMDIPTPEHEFLLWSWGGKNTAMVVVLLLSTLSRRLLPHLIALGMLLTGQVGDINAGLQSGTNVFITYVALGLVVTQLLLLAYGGLLSRAMTVDEREPVAV